jgi:purine-binding chemotaxis protein CheW
MAHADLAQPKITNAASRSADHRRKYLAFHLGAEEFGIQVMKVREIIGVQDITAVPHTPDYVNGVINLRGRVIPILDLRLKLRMPKAAYTSSTCIIVIEAVSPGGKLLIGVVVDGVSEVLTVAQADVEPPPAFGNEMQFQHVLGMAKVNGKVKILLDIDHVLASEAALGQLDSNEYKKVDVNADHQANK